MRGSKREPGKGGSEAGERSSAQRRPALLIVLALALFVSGCIAILVGSMGPIGPGEPRRISFEEAFEVIFTGNGPSDSVPVIWDLRFPRVILAGAIGAALACAGTAMQAVFRNPMADPFIIGVSSGAEVGAVSAELIGMTAILSAAQPIMAFVCSLATVFLVYAMGTIRGRVHVETLLLSGVAVAAFLGAVVSFLIYFARQDYHELIPWLLGSLYEASWTHVSIVIGPIVAGSIVIFLYGRDMNALLLGEETAHNLGAEPEFLKKLMLGVAALITAGAVAFVGIVGFVGLIVPHMMRMLVGANHRVLVPAATLFGASFMIWADTVARTVVTGQELPVGIITALCGGPFFLYLLRSSKMRGGPP